jgi:hypothetical protein
MIYPLVPLFLANVLGVNKSMIGLIEGIAEATASLLKVFSGWLSDRIGRRKGLMMAGYAMSTLSRPILALAGTWQQVLVSRFGDRLGKGVRTAPRDAIIAESSESTHMARAFSFHRAHGHHGRGGRPGNCPSGAAIPSHLLPDGILALHDPWHHRGSHHHSVHPGQGACVGFFRGTPACEPAKF